MRKTASSLFLAAALFAAACPAFAGETSRREVGFSARAIPSVIHVGDEVRFILHAEIPKGFSLAPISPKTDFSPFELRSIDKPLVVQKKDTILQTFIIRLTIFRTGDYEIPSIPITVWNVASQGALARTPPVPVKVVSVGKTKKDGGDVRPIKGPAELDLRHLWDWVYGGLLVLALAALAVSMIFRKRREMADLESRLPAHERAFLELERLAENHWLAAGKEKDHYSALAGVLKRYLMRRYGLDFADDTTPETVAALKAKNFETSIVDDVRVVLENADLVKFARLVPPRSLAEETERRLKALVERTKLSDGEGARR